MSFVNTTDLSQAGAPCRWKDMRRALLLHTAERDILAAARAANPAARITLKFPNWYDSYQDMGHALGSWEPGNLGLTETNSSKTHTTITCTQHKRVGIGCVDTTNVWP